MLSKKDGYLVCSAKLKIIILKKDFRKHINSTILPKNMVLQNTLQIFRKFLKRKNFDK